MSAGLWEGQQSDTWHLGKTPQLFQVESGIVQGTIGQLFPRSLENLFPPGGTWSYQLIWRTGKRKLHTGGVYGGQWSNLLIA